MDKATFDQYLELGQTIKTGQYAALPSVEALEEQFSGKDSVSAIFDGRVWENHESCVGIDETPGDREMLVKHFGVRMTSDAVIAWADENGYRVATHKEAIAFAAKNPELQRQYWIVALGSSALRDDGNRFVAVLGSVGRRRILDGNWFGGGWGGGDRFLLVRK